MNRLVKMTGLSTLLAGAFACGGPVDGENPSLSSTGTVDGEESEQLAEQSSAIFGSDACKDIDIKITNYQEDGSNPTTIRVLYVKAYSASEGRWITEDLANTDISYGSSHWWWNEDLQYAENDTISTWQVYYKKQEQDDGWSSTTYYQQINTTDDVCHANDNYELTVN